MTAPIETQIDKWDEIASALQAETEKVEAILAQRKRLQALRRKLAEEHIETPQIAIMELVAAMFGVSLKDMVSRKRPEKIVAPRQVAMKLLYEHPSFGLSLEEVGHFVGGRDHGTVIHAIRAVSARCETNPAFKMKVDELTAKISPPSPRI